MGVRTRFAPSPTGFMHIGNLRTALYAFLFARHFGGEFVLRIEDTDRERHVEGAERAMRDALEKAGLKYDEGPDVGGPCGPYVQSERKEIYLRYAEELMRANGAYRCFCARERLDGLKDGKGIGKYDKHCLRLDKGEIRARLEAGEPYVVRQNVPESGMTEYDDLVYGKIRVPCEDMEDGILIKSDGMPTYNFANVVDDHLMRITHVVRGAEYLSSTPKYNLMYDAFGWERPQYIHLPPIMRDERHKLSKRYGDAHFEDFAEKGYLPEAIVNYIALLGWSPKSDAEKMSMAELIEAFDVGGISKSPSMFDEGKMRWLNRAYVTELGFDEFMARATPYFERSVARGKYDYAKFGRVLQSRIEVFSDIPAAVEFIERFGEYDIGLFARKRLGADPKTAAECLREGIEILGGLNPFGIDAMREEVEKRCERKGMKPRTMLHCLRVGLTGCATTPGGACEMADILGRDEAVRRLKFSIGLLERGAK